MSDEKIVRAVLTDDGQTLIEQPDGSYRKAQKATDWVRVSAMTADEVEAAARADGDAPPLDDEFWRNARVVIPPRILKRHQGLRIDEDVIDWFKQQGPGYQTRMNAVLRSYVEAHKRTQKSSGDPRARSR